jgi:hypothetical protein
LYLEGEGEGLLLASPSPSPSYFQIQPENKSLKDLEIIENLEKKSLLIDDDNADLVILSFYHLR